MRRLRLTLGLGTLAAFVLACPRGAGPADAGGTTGRGSTGGGRSSGGSSGGSTGGSDGGFDGGGSGPCHYDSDCLASGMRCAADGGCTLPATACSPTQGSSNCTSDSYCWIDGIIQGTNDCYCHPLPDGGGLCYLAQPPCAPCREPLDCGTPDQNVQTPATCGPVGDGGNYCLPLYQTGSCPQGFLPGVIDGGIAVCVPSCGVCPCSGCTGDGDCPQPAAGVCNGKGVCQAPCQSDADCPGADVCNVLGKYLDPALGTLYAAGKCGAACAQDTDCAKYQGDASVPFVCDLDAGRVCRPAGCLHDTDCVGAARPGSDFIGWCDIWAQNQCVADACRLGISPVTGAAFDDCVGGYECALPDGGSPGPLDAGAPGEGACFLIPCNEVPGGAHVACNAGQLCCGEGDAGDSCGGAAVGACYPEPVPPWCQSCNPQNGSYFSPDCAAVNDGFPGAVACTTSPSAKQPVAWCGPSCDPEEPWTCPAGWNCDRQVYYAAGPTGCVGASFDAGPNGYECVCDAGSDCPSVGLVLYEGPDCSVCPQGDAGCQPASDGLGVNCSCDPAADAGCPPYQYGGQSFSTACQAVQGGNACVVFLPMQCASSVCIFGYNCAATAYGCPDAG